MRLVVVLFYAYVTCFVISFCSYLVVISFLSPCSSNIVSCVLVQDISVLQDQEAVKQLGHILKTNVRGSTAVGHPFVNQVSLYEGCI